MSLPLHPRLLPHTTELPHFGPIGYTLSGLPLVGSAWPVWNGFIQKQQAWRGHGGSPETGYLWHYHHPAIKSDPTGEYARPDELIGWAMDGFPIYGPLPAGDATRATAASPTEATATTCVASRRSTCRCRTAAATARAGPPTGRSSWAASTATCRAPPSASGRASDGSSAAVNLERGSCSTAAVVSVYRRVESRNRDTVRTSTVSFLL